MLAIPRWLDRPFLLLTLTALIWGGNAVAGRLADGHVSPMWLTFGRWLIAVVVVGLVGRDAIRADWPVIRRHWRYLAVMGATGFTFFNFLLYTAAKYTSAVNVALLQSAMPLFIFALGYAAFQTPVRWVQAGGFALTAAGVWVTATSGDVLAAFRGEGAGVNRGDAIMLLAALAYAAYSVGLRAKPDMRPLSFLFAIVLAALLAAGIGLVMEIASGTAMAPHDVQGWGRRPLRGAVGRHRRAGLLHSRRRRRGREHGRAVHQPRAGLRRAPVRPDPRRASATVPRGRVRPGRRRRLGRRALAAHSGTNFAPDPSRGPRGHVARPTRCKDMAMNALSRRSALLGAASITLAAPLVASAAFAQSDPDRYVALTLEGGLFAKKSSELALEKSSNELVTGFANLEIAEQKAVAEVLAAAGGTPPADVDGEEKVLMEKLMGLDGAAFDMAYIDGQIAGHEELLAIQQPMSGMSEITIPVATAKLAEEAIKTHIAMLKGIKGMM